MDLGWEDYHHLNVVLLSAIGLWPYGSRLVLHIKRIIWTSLAFICCTAQLATFITVDYTKGLLLKNVSCISVGIGILFKYLLLRTSSDWIRNVTDAINADWKDLLCKEEIRIIEKYIERGKFHTKGFAMFVSPAGLCLSLLPLSSIFLDFVMPLVESRNRSFPIMFETFYDQQNHFFITVSVFEAAALCGVLVFIATETIFIVYVQHACALFEVTRFSTTLKERFMLSYLILLFLGILSLGAHVLHCTETFTSDEFSEFLTSSMFCLAILGYMFYLNFVLQRFLDSSAVIFDNWYQSEWYECPTSTQKLVLFCMLNSVKPVPLEIYGIFTPSYEGFSMIVRMSMSYVTALLSFK